MLMDWGIWKGRILSHTPAANAIVESSHPIFGQILRTTLHVTAVKTKAELEAAFDDVENVSLVSSVGPSVLSALIVALNAPQLPATGYEIHQH